jgi:myosin-5
LAINSLEQLAINYCNERLHNHFITYVLCKEQDIYISEGIDYTRVPPRLNDEIISLIDGKGGIFALLDDEAKVLKGSDSTFLGKLDKSQPKPSPTTLYYKDVKMTKTQFSVRHFAGEVKYESSGFLEKNKDKLYDHMEDILNSTSNEKFSELMSASAKRDTIVAAGGSGETTSTKKKATLVTLLGRFQSQLRKNLQYLYFPLPLILISIVFR